MLKGKRGLGVSVLFLLAAIISVVLLQVKSAHCDDFGCDGNLCDKSNPCNRGCKCVYPKGAKVGYCAPWYQSSAEKSIASEQAKKYTCKCDSPCSGSIKCDTGCYAFCEENPEGSGRHVCIKGCADDLLSEKETHVFDQKTKFSSVSLKMSKRTAKFVLARLFDTAQPVSEIKTVGTGADKIVNIELKNTDFNGIMQELSK